MRKLAWSLALMATFTVHSAANAVRFRIDAFGSLIVPPSNNPIPGFTFGNGSSVFASWTVNFAAATPEDVLPVGGAGQARIYRGAVSNGVLVVGGLPGTASFAFRQNGNSAGAAYVINDGRPAANNPNIRLDQVSINDGASFAPGIVIPSYTLESGLAPDIYIRSLSFGRSSVTVNGTNPTLVTSPNVPDFAALLLAPTGGANGNNFFGFTLARGPIGPGGPPAPFQNFSVGGIQLNITPLAVPEPAAWAMLIAGFGLAGAGLRRHRTLTAPA